MSNIIIFIEEIAFAYVILKKYHDNKFSSGFDIRKEILLDGLHWAFKNDLKQLFLLEVVNDQELFLTRRFEFSTDDYKYYLAKVSKIFQGGVEKPIDGRYIDPTILSFFQSLLGKSLEPYKADELFDSITDHGDPFPVMSA